MTRFLFLILPCCFLFCLSANGQEGISIKEASEKIQKKFKKINEYSRKGESKKALEESIKLLKKDPNIVDLHLRIASIYFNQEKYSEANTYFDQAVALDPEFDYRMYYSQGLTKHKLKKYGEARDALDKYIERTQKKEKKIQAQRLRDNCAFAANAIKSPVPFEPTRLPPSINTGASEYLPFIPLDQESIIFTTRDGIQEDIFYCNIENGEIQESYPLDAINTDYDEGASTISIDGRIIIFATTDRIKSMGSFDLAYAFKGKDGEFGRTHSLGKTINSPTWDSQPSLSVDGNKLYFSSKRKGGYGGSDLYVSYRNKKGQWTIPQNLGPTINTKYDDESPFIHPDDQTLYFRSSGRPGMGGFDIYMAKLDQKTLEWSEPVNLGYPINSEGSEGALCVSPDGKTAYFASDLEWESLYEQANLDIFSFELPTNLRPTPVTYVKAKFKNAKTKEGVKASFKIINNETQVVLHDLSDKEVGSFYVSLPVGSSYSLNINKEGYNFYSESFRLDSVQSIYKPYILDALLSPIIELEEIEVAVSKPEPVILKNIVFKSGTAVLDAKSQPEIQAFYDFLSSNSFHVKLQGHTDNVGSEEANMKLSLDRAKAVYDRLIDLGISSNRLSYEGFGESQPIESNDEESGRSVNRRTEFVIIYK